MRVNKSGRCRSLVQERIPWGRLILGLVFHAICIFCLHRALDKIHTWKLFAFGKIFAHGKIKSGRKSLVKKEKKKAPKEKEREPFRQEKETILCESDWYWRSSVLASRFRTKKSPSNQNLSYIKLKNQVSFYLYKYQP